MKQIKSCGFILFRGEPTDPQKSFLLMRHKDRYDLPKGHVDAGESDLECALREMTEETGIPIDGVRVDPEFEYRSNYQVKYARYNDETLDKTLIIFLGWVDRNTSITLTEHVGYEWINWYPPHHIQPQTIDPLLAEVAAYFDRLELAK
jgi:bis(5'-nucleosidyl)-tetraphosphatase